MTILLDHCMPRHYEKLLQDWGYPITTVREHIDVRSVDPDVIQLAQTLDAVLLTIDTGFLNIQQYPPQNFQGIIVLREEHRARKAIEQQLQTVLKMLYRDELRASVVRVTAIDYKVYRE